MSRALRTSGVIVSALALGMWIGASWHCATSDLPGQGPCCAPFVQVQRCACAHPKIAIQTLTAAKECPVCQTGALTQDAPSIAALPPLVEAHSGETILSFVVHACDQVARPLPPQTGPPA